MDSDERNTPELFSWQREEIAQAAWFSSAAAQIPALIHDQSLLANENGLAIWIENLRGYSDGLTFDIELRIASSVRENLHIDVMPDLSAHFSEHHEVIIWAEVDGQRYTNTRSDESSWHLVLIGANATPGIAKATWWIPEVPRESFHVSASWPEGSLAASVGLDASGWASAIDSKAVTISN